MLKSRPTPSGHSRHENTRTQPINGHRIFNNPHIVTEGWYPVCRSSELKKKKARSFLIFKQRIALYRTESGIVHALDAFCPHLGTDLGNGDVTGDNLRCYFHQWEFAGDGKLAKVACRKELDRVLGEVKNKSYPVEERYGHIWVFAGETATHPLPTPPGSEGEKLSALFLKEVTILAHHHVMMVNGIDLQHFATVHALDIKFDYQIEDDGKGVFNWTLEGEIPTNNLKGKLARLLLGPRFRYRVKFAGGSIVSITYGEDQKFLGFKLPSLHILWGCTPLVSGVSKIKIFFVTKKRNLLFNALNYLATLGLIVLLKDEDIRAFPNMRFNTARLISEDESVGRFIQLTNKLVASKWGDEA
jgi:phenylpropionate dioxygenase-like ring-hydroxylating dioxygenase large terminal subunit